MQQFEVIEGHYVGTLSDGSAVVEEEDGTITVIPPADIERVEHIACADR